MFAVVGFTPDAIKFVAFSDRKITTNYRPYQFAVTSNPTAWVAIRRFSFAALSKMITCRT